MVTMFVAGWAVLTLLAVLAVLAAVSPASAATFKRLAYIVNSGANTISVINTATNTVAATIAGFHRPVGAAVTPDRTRAYVTNSGNFTGTTVSVINVFDPGTVTVGVGAGLAGMAIADIPEPPNPNPTGLPVTGSPAGAAWLAIALTTTSTGAVLLLVANRWARRRRRTD
jgi:YVTN family beta-propeller protein